MLHRCIFALTLFTLVLVTRGVTARPLPIVEQTGVDATTLSPSPQTLALPPALAPGTANGPVTESLVSLPSPHVEDTVAPEAGNVQETPQTMSNVEVTQLNTPTGPVVESIATQATANDNPPIPAAITPAQDASSTTVVKDKGETTTKTPSEEPKSQAAEAATAILAKSSPSTETSAVVPLEKVEEHKSVETKGDPTVAAEADNTETPAPEQQTTDAPVNTQNNNDVAAGSQVEEAEPHNDPSPKSIYVPVVDNVASVPPNTDVTKMEETPKKDAKTESSNETKVDPKSTTETTTHGTSQTPPPLPPSDGKEPPNKDVKAEGSNETKVDPESMKLTGDVTEATVPATETITEVHETSQTALPPPPSGRKHAKHNKVQTTDADGTNVNGKGTEPSQTTLDNPAGSLQNKILPLINNKRARHQSSPLKWNATLAHMASLRLEGQCVMPYDQERDRRGVTYALIKNVDKATEPDISQAVSDWYDEGRLFEYSKPARSNVYQYFVQIVWRATTQVGCATMACGDNDNSVGLFCVWDPAGNAVIENIPLKADGTPENVDINKKIRRNVRPAVPPSP